MEKPKRRRRISDIGGSTEQKQTMYADPTDNYAGATLRGPRFPERRPSSTRRFPNSIASGKPKKYSKQSHLRRQEPSTDTRNLGSFQTLYPNGLTPPLISTPETNGSSQKLVIMPDDSDIDDEQQTKKPTTPSVSTSTEKDKRSIALTARGFEDVKTEPLTEDMMKRTMFLVTIHDSTMGPVPVPFTECGNFDVVF